MTFCYRATLEAPQGQIGGFLSQLPYTCHQNRWHLWENDLRFAPNNRTGYERDIFTDNPLVRIYLIIETTLVDRPCAMGV